MAGSPAAVTTASGSNPIPANTMVDHYREHLGFYSGSYKTAIADPTAAPGLVVAGGGTLPGGTYLVGYTYTNASGETKLSPLASVTVPAASTITATAPALPSGATGVGYYLSLPNGSIPYLVATQAGLSFAHNAAPTANQQSSVAPTQSDGDSADYRTNAYFAGANQHPLRNRDTTAYPTQVADDSWIVHIRQKGGTV